MVDNIVNNKGGLFNRQIGRREGIMDVVDLLKRLSNRNISHNKEMFYEK